MDWFLHDNGLRHERVKLLQVFEVSMTLEFIQLLKSSFKTQLKRDQAPSLSTHHIPSIYENPKLQFNLSLRSL